MKYRVESDVLGRVKIPSDAYYGSETQRAVNNFQISGLRIQRDFIRAYVILKRSAAIANMKTQKLDHLRGRAIVRACKEILDGKFSDQFVVDVFQAGAGTSTNMNVNEVIANVALEILKHKKGNYKILHPNDHVNMSQSTNDTYPSAIRIASYLAVTDKLLPALIGLEGALKEKSQEFSHIVKLGRTHLQDALPMTLGAEFSGYGGEASKVIERIGNARSLLLEIPIGGTAIGTGMNADDSYVTSFILELNRYTHTHFRRSEYVFADMQAGLAELNLSQALEFTAIALGKTANDFRLLGSGPRGGINELLIPEIQPGSSIMPGKINPSMPEMLNMVCMQVIGSSATIREAAAGGQLELNVFMPVISFNLLFSIEILANGIKAFAGRCVKGLRANRERIESHLRMNLSIATALTPYIGYSKAAGIARLAYKKNRSVKDICLELKVMDKKSLDKILDPRRYV